MLDKNQIIVELEKENNKLKYQIKLLNNIIDELDKLFEYYYIGNMKYNQDTINDIYKRYNKLKELKGEKSEKI